jgi:hypothetical protein
MLPADGVHPYLVDVLATGPPPEGVDDSDRITGMINHVPDCELVLCPDSDDEGGIDFDLTEKSDCAWIISDADPLDDATWTRRKQDNFAFMMPLGPEESKTILPSWIKTHTMTHQHW